MELVEKFKQQFHCFFRQTKPQVESSQEPFVFSTAAVASDTLKSVNQDAWALRTVAGTGVTLIAVADGVGSVAKAEDGSRFVANKAVELLESAVHTSQPLDYFKLFTGIQQELDAMVLRTYGKTADAFGNNAFATTLIVGVDTPDSFTVAYVGNGCAFHIFTDFIDFPENHPMPWSVTNLLSPHSALNPNSGRDEMYRYFGFRAAPKQYEPTVVTISKDRIKGELFVIATDGLESADHQRIGRRSDGFWMMLNEKISLLCKELRHCLTEDFNTENLQNMLLSLMQSLKDNSLMDDDVTIGVIVSPRAVAYANHYNE